MMFWSRGLGRTIWSRVDGERGLERVAKREVLRGEEIVDSRRNRESVARGNQEV